MIRNEELPDILKDLKRISNFQFDYLVLSAKESLFQPLKAAVKKETHTIRFNQQYSTKEIARNLCDVAKSKDIQKGKIVGFDDSDVEQVINIYNMPDVLGDMDFDDLAKTIIEADLTKIEEIPCIKQLVGIIEKDKVRFVNP